MRTLTLAVLTLGLSALGSAQDDATYTWPVVAPVAGQVSKLKLEVKFQAMGQDALITGVLGRKVLSVEPSGDYSVESSVEGLKVKLMNDEMDQDSPPSVRKFHADGTPVEKRTYENGIDETVSALVFAHLPKEAVKVGAKWEIDKNASLPGKGSASLTSVNEKSGHKCFIVAVEYLCGDGQGSIKGTVAFDTTSGDVIDVDAAFKNLAVASGINSDGTVKIGIVAAVRN